MPLNYLWRLHLSKETTNLDLDKDILTLTDPALYWIVTPRDKIIVPRRIEAHRIRRSRRARKEVHDLLVGLGLGLYSASPDGAWWYKGLDTKGKEIRIKWMYYETSEGVIREFKFYQGWKLSSKKEFLRYIVKFRKFYNKQSTQAVS